MATKTKANTMVDIHLSVDWTFAGKGIMRNLAFKYVDTPYIYGGNGPDGFDCSGLVCELLKSSGFVAENEDFTAAGLYDIFADRKVPVPREGCLLFRVKTSGPVKEIVHVAYALSHYHMVEAGGGSVSTDSVEKARKRNARVRIRKIPKRRDGINLPSNWLCVDLYKND